MDTRERLMAYRDLRKTDAVKAQAFLEENLHDERFASLANLGKAFIDGFNKRLDEKVRMSERERRLLLNAFEVEFLQGWGNVMSFAATTAREAAQRVLS